MGTFVLVALFCAIIVIGFFFLRAKAWEDREIASTDYRRPRPIVDRNGVEYLPVANRPGIYHGGDGSMLTNLALYVLLAPDVQAQWETPKGYREGMTLNEAIAASEHELVRMGQEDAERGVVQTSDGPVIDGTFTRVDQPTVTAEPAPSFDDDSRSIWSGGGFDTSSSSGGFDSGFGGGGGDSY